LGLVEDSTAFSEACPTIRDGVVLNGVGTAFVCA
jgi:hypothetical protein